MKKIFFQDFAFQSSGNFYIKTQESYIEMGPFLEICDQNGSYRLFVQSESGHWLRSVQELHDEALNQVRKEKKNLNGK